jgi:hypothetical protein
MVQHGGFFSIKGLQNYAAGKAVGLFWWRHWASGKRKPRKVSQARLTLDV